MASEIFIDTSGFYALLVRGDDQHARATEILREAAGDRRRFVTTDYVLDETATLLLARGYAGVIANLFDRVLESGACRVTWMDADYFRKTRQFFLKNLERSWSFTDCFSFIVMKELRLRDALSKDSHFKPAGFTPLLIQ
ncbi:MAG: type II toxin-antitoxin system VapC family toxin [Deltaproteobacteria bacterium]|nr:type II toxin-antitoxin system VapC family toxin [Deltaproteobacteria bacterium]